jgi:NADPH:quinone reductase-like Zn-dependent oxidoreductase
MRLRGSEPTLVEEDSPEPRLGPDDVLVRVYAAGVTPTELSWYPTTHAKTGAVRTRAIPGHEFSGVVESVGARVSGVTPGQEVYGMNDWFAEGATAEYCLAKPSSIAPKPSRLTHVESASVPIGALTAWQGLADRAKIRPGERVLIHGGAGAVGLFAVQIAKMLGAEVLATASPRNFDFLTQLGVNRTIDYHSERFEDIVKDVDVVFDTVGGETLQRSWNVLSPNGRMVTVAAGDETSDDERVKEAFFIVEPKREQLSQIAALIDAGKIEPVVDAVLSFSQAPAAYAGKIPSRLGRGKMVVAVSAQASIPAIATHVSSA